MKVIGCLFTFLGLSLGVAACILILILYGDCALFSLLALLLSFGGFVLVSLGRACC